MSATNVTPFLGEYLSSQDRKEALRILRGVRKKTVATHWIKGSLSGLRSVLTNRLSQRGEQAPKRSGKEVMLFTRREKEFKTCACLVGLMRWEAVGDREGEIVRNHPEYKPYSGAVAAVAETIISRTRTRHNYYEPLNEYGEPALSLAETDCISFNDAKRTTRDDIVDTVDAAISLLERK